jgi:membrane protein implicated in regulation of membrane protease activity
MQHVEFWWLAAGVGLIVVELLVSGFVAVFFGIGAIVVGLALWMGMPASGPLPWLLFSVTALALLFGLRARFREWFTGRSISRDVDDDFVGRTARVVDGFADATHAFGRVDYRGANWDAQCPSGSVLAAGERVRITGRDGTTLHVEKEVA